MTKPNFIIVGAPRSGTTTLFHSLKQHPEIYMSYVKEPYYFCTDFHEESDQFHNKEIRFPIRTEKASTCRRAFFGHRHCIIQKELDWLNRSRDILTTFQDDKSRYLSSTISKRMSWEPTKAFWDFLELIPDSHLKQKPTTKTGYQDSRLLIASFLCLAT